MGSLCRGGRKKEEIGRSVKVRCGCGRQDEDGEQKSLKIDLELNGSIYQYLVGNERARLQILLAHKRARARKTCRKSNNMSVDME